MDERQNTHLSALVFAVSATAYFPVGAAESGERRNIKEALSNKYISHDRAVRK